MVSPYCQADEHESCSKRIRRQNGKLYSCKCTCHPVVVISPKKDEPEDDEMDY